MARWISTIVATALPKIGLALHARIKLLSWTITIYSLGQVDHVAARRSISDQLGRQAALLLCAFFHSVIGRVRLREQHLHLVPLRFIQSIGGGGFLPSASGIRRPTTSAVSADRALGMFSSILPHRGRRRADLSEVSSPQYWGLAWHLLRPNAPIGIA